MAVHGADEPQFQSQERRQSGGAVTQAADQIDNVPVLKRQRCVAGEVGRGGQAVYQPQKLIIALVQQGGLRIQLGVLFPGAGGSQLRGGQMQIAESAPQLRGDIGKQGCQLILIRLHEKLLSGI